jgi:hypothetical protein
MKIYIKTKSIIIFYSLLILNLIFVNCNKGSGTNMFSFLNKKDKITLFWEWFTKNEVLINNINQDNSEQIIDNILKQIQKIQKGLAVEISLPDSNGVRELTISPDGVSDAFPIVQSIVTKAPKLINWRIIAFRQRAPEGFKLEYQDLILDPKEMYCEPILTNGDLNLVVYVNDYKKIDVNTINYYCLIMMDNLIGEYDCVMTIKHYEFIDLSEMTKGNQQMKLNELPKYIDEFKNNKKK